MKKVFSCFVALMLSIGLWAQQTPVSYLYPEYNTPDDPTSGIKIWHTGECTNYTEVAGSTSAVTWGTAGTTTWYVVTGTVTLSKGAICNGAVHLILTDGASLTVSGGASKAGIQVSGTGNSLTIYAQSTDDQMGELAATGRQYSAGIGGSKDADGSNITINGGNVTAKSGDAAAGIGGGRYGQGSYITINGGVVTAVGKSSCIGGGSGDDDDDPGLYNVDGSHITINGGTVIAVAEENGAPGIGGGYWGGAGRYITINDGQVTAEGGDYAAGIGGGTLGVASNITIRGGIIEATAGQYGAGIGTASVEEGGAEYITISGGHVTATGVDQGAGIGGGTDAYASHITISGGEVFATGGQYAAGIGGGRSELKTLSNSDIIISGGQVTATGGQYAAGIGGGDKSYGSNNIIISGGQVTATGGSSADGIGCGRQAKSTSTIYVADACVVKAGTSANPTDVISHASITTNIASDLAGKRYATVETFENVTFSETGTKADFTAQLGKTVNATIARTFYADGENNTLCLPFSLTAEQLAASPLAGYSRLQEFSSATIQNQGQDDETLVLDMTDVTEVEAGKPYIIAWEDGDNIVSPVFESVTITVDEALVSEKLGGVTFCGTLIPMAVEAGDKGIMFVGLGGMLNWPNVGGSINGLRSYFAVDLGATNAPRRGMRAMLNGGRTIPTDMDNTEMAIKAQKLIEQGRVVIISNGVRYDLNGNEIR